MIGATGVMGRSGGSGSAPGRLLSITRLTGTGSFSPTANTATMIVLGVAGGASGGAARGATGTNEVLGIGGGSGGSFVKTYTSVAGPYTYSVGAGGAGSTTGGHDGGNTVFDSGGTPITAYGGKWLPTDDNTGGTGHCAVYNPISSPWTVVPCAGGEGGAVSTNGDASGGNRAGQPGGSPLPAGAGAGLSGAGAPGPFGGGGRAVSLATATGIDGAAPGAGGSGGAGDNSGPYAGGSGASGMLWVYCYSAT